jgi:hypothetical protein
MKKQDERPEERGHMAVGEALRVEKGPVEVRGLAQKA